ncbi:helix-turn-helix domain-containing protein [Algoriphagus sediminis]|uniref:Helix-turn-helix domain-containing protein n=1 Tax=Algoriphagus sediminis TaxID=3057113 RepID=A0ABT7YHE7_9BACT|nr:helix-turn-helix domain-containing protein [Algoriphagus sediminis]MDN3205967.1 helix-turn-helix domain-containing protein [Algoriphagus sediminis]
MKKVLISVLILFPTFLSLGQDTLFMDRHEFDSPVQNVFDAEGQIYLKTTVSLYQLQGQNWKKIDQGFDKRYIFYDENFYESDFIPDKDLFDISSMEELIPQRGKFIATAARKGSRFFVASGSMLFEYEIREHYTKSYHNKSIRDIYLNDSLRVISTYSGIYVNDSILLKSPNYSNGPLTNIDSTFYLTWDEISIFFPPDSTRLIQNSTNLFSGKARKIMKWKKNLYTLHTRAFSKVLDEFELLPIHQGLEYLDLEVFQDKLTFSTAEGFLLTWDEMRLDTLAALSTKITDLYPAEDRLFLSTNTGLFVWDHKSQSISQIAEIPNVVMTSLDDFNNLWISTEGGLYILTNESQDLIPVISNVEFNREALLLKDGYLYVGAVDGLYQLNTYEIQKSFIPQELNKLNLAKSGIDSQTFWFILFLSMGLVLGFGYWYLRTKNKSIRQNLPANPNPWTLDNLETLIQESNIQTVESLASALNTNTVQLNRKFKKLGTTPGKFLKKVRIKKAKKLLKEGVSLEVISEKMGYSINLLKKELNI